MSSNTLDNVQSARPAAIGQATHVEQARAVSEVAAAVRVAQEIPRDVSRARADMLESCQQLGLAERSAFSFRRGGQSVVGPSIHLARELARCWGNIQYGLTELSRDDVNGSSQMIAFAWDVQTNARSSSTFIVPHVRDTKDGNVKLTATRDIYENNANQGARRVREAIFAVLPTWFTEEAKAVCRRTLEEGVGNKPLAVRIDEMVTAYSRASITVRQLEARVGAPKTDWTVQDVATLAVVFTSLRNGETRRDDEFPPQTAAVTADEVAGRQPAPAAGAAEVTAPPPTTGEAKQPLIDEIYALAIELELNDADVDGDFAARHDGLALTSGTTEQLVAFRDGLKAEVAAR